MYDDCIAVNVARAWRRERLLLLGQLSAWMVTVFRRGDADQMVMIDYEPNWVQQLPQALGCSSMTIEYMNVNAMPRIPHLINWPTS